MDATGGTLQFVPPGQSWMQLHQKQSPFLHGKGAGVGALPPPPQQWFQNGGGGTRFNQQQHGQWRSHAAADVSERTRARDQQIHTPKGSRASPGWQHQQHQQQYQHQQQQHLGRHGQGFQASFGQGPQQQQPFRRPGPPEAGIAQHGPGGGGAGGLPPRLQNLHHHQQQQPFQGAAAAVLPPRFQSRQAQPFVPLQAAVKSRAVTGRGPHGQGGQRREQEAEEEQKQQNSTASCEQSPASKSIDGSAGTPDKARSTPAKGSGAAAARKARKVRIAARFTYGMDGVDEGQQPPAASDTAASPAPATEQQK